MGHYDRDLLDQAKIVDLKEKTGSGPTVPLTPADAPGILVGEQSIDWDGRRRFNWRPTFILVGLAVIVMLAVAFL